MSTLYQKVGRRYVALSVYDPMALDSMPIGSHLVTVTPGVKFTRFSVEPNHAALLAALDLHRDALADVLRKAVQAEPTTAQRGKRLKAWEAYKAALDEEDPVLTLSRKSAADVVDALHRSILERCVGCVGKGSR